MAGYNYNYHWGNTSSDEPADETYVETPHGEFESTYKTIPIRAAAVYRNTSKMEKLQDKLSDQFRSTFTVKDNDDAEDVILVHYYPDEVDDEFDEGDVVEFVRVHFDGNAHLYEE